MLAVEVRFEAAGSEPNFFCAPNATFCYFFSIPKQFGAFLAIKCKQNQGSPPSASLTLADLGPLLASVVGQAHCCSVVIVNNKNSVQLPTFGSSSLFTPLGARRYVYSCVQVRTGAYRCVQLCTVVLP